MAEQLVSLISGGGSTMEQIGLAAQEGRIPGLELTGVIASDTVKAAKGIERALKLGVTVIVVNPERFRQDNGEIDSYGFGQELSRGIEKFGGSVVTQNGWLPWTPENVIERYRDTIFNQHPGPLPETKKQHGTMPHATMIEFSELTGRNEGSMVVAQRVAPIMDNGALVGFRHVDIYDGDTAKDLQERALPIEHQLQIDFLNELMRGELLEIKQEYVFMRPGEEGILKAARREARKQYPNG